MLRPILLSIGVAALLLSITLAVSVVAAQGGGDRASIDVESAAPVIFDCSTSSDVPESECDALVALYEATAGANWDDKSGWLVDTALCNWYGLHCNDGHVDRILLGNNALSGTLPTTVDHLPNLVILSLEENELTDSIPSTVGNLSALETLALFDNDFSGAIPAELGSLSNLVHLLLSDLPSLGGQMPTELGNLSNLIWLELNGTALAGPIPPSFVNLTSMYEFSFDNTTLCEPTNAAVQAWLADVPILTSSELTCGEPVPSTTPTATSTNTPTSTTTPTSTPTATPTATGTPTLTGKTFLPLTR